MIRIFYLHDTKIRVRECFLCGTKHQDKSKRIVTVAWDDSDRTNVRYAYSINAENLGDDYNPKWGVDTATSRVTRNREKHPPKYAQVPEGADNFAIRREILRAITNEKAASRDKDATVKRIAARYLAKWESQPAQAEKAA